MREKGKQVEKKKTNYVQSIFQLVRLEHGILYGIGVLIGMVLSGGISTTEAILGFLIAVVMECGAFAMNDYVDYEVDKLNKRMDRPLVSGKIKRETALHISLACFFIGILLSFVLSFLTSWYILILILILFLFSVGYNLLLKRYPLIGNAYIAITMAIPFLFGGLINSTVNEKIAIISAIVFFFGLGREIMKDIEDYSAEKMLKFNTLPILIGKKKAVYSVIVCYLVGIVFSIYPLITFFSKTAVYYFVIPLDIIFVYVCARLLKSQSLSNLRKMRKITLVAMAAGLVIFLISSLLAF
jgi:geranylgeranylglycerol-phosphate geranylgeranyltransferase